jgi:uncharacterized membrane protein
MFFLLFGIALFVAIHLLPTFSSQRKLLIDRLGHLPYLALFSAISLIAFLLIIYGYSQADRTPLWQPLAFGRSLAKLRHPMLIGTAIWAIAHLTTTGDIASVILFGSFLFYALADMIMARPRQTLIPSGTPSVIHDLIAVTLGLMAYASVLYAHEILFSVDIFKDRII